MNKLNASVTLNIEFTDLELLSKLNYLTTELAISLDDFIIVSIDRLVNDIYFFRNLRSHNKPKI